MGETSKLKVTDFCVLCSSLQVLCTNQMHRHRMKRACLANTICEKDLRIEADCKLNMNERLEDQSILGCPVEIWESWASRLQGLKPFWRRAVKGTVKRNGRN